MNEKQIAAEKAVDFIENGMMVGLGTGSTVTYMIKKLAEKVDEGLKITAVSTSIATTKLAESMGIHILNFDDVREIDLTIDGADEVDKNLNGIKGGGGALLIEKIVATSSRKNIWIIESTKLVADLGKFPLPVEVVPFGIEHTISKLKDGGYNPELRRVDNNNFLTDGNNYTIDLHLNKIADPDNLESALKKIPGIIETGLFINIADMVIAGKENSYEILKRG
jgi:ribose 5-phosphate isomerase A